MMAGSACFLASCLVLLWLCAPAQGGEEPPKEQPTELVYSAEKLDWEKTVATYKEDERRLVKRQFELVEDKDTKSGKALLVRLDKKRVRDADFPFFTTEPVALPVGRYRASVRVKLVGMLAVLGTPIYVDVVGVGRRVELRGYQFKAEDEYQEFSFEFDVMEPDLVTGRPKVYEATSPFNAGPSLWRQLEPALEAKRRHERGVYTEEETKKRQEELKRVQTPKPALSMGFGQTRRVVAMGEDLPDNTIHSVTIDYVKVTRVPEPPVRVLQVIAGKRWMKPGQETLFRVWLGSRSKKEESVELNLYLEHGLDVRDKIGSRKVTLAPGAYRVEGFDFKTAPDQPKWGYAVVAEAVEGGKVISKADDVFTVHPNNFAVKNFGGPGPSTYRNHAEVFGCTAGDCACVYIPDPELPYRTGMSGYVTNDRSQKAAIDWNRDVGVSTVMYLFPGYTENWGADLYLRHPEYFTGRLNFSDDAYAINEAATRLAQELYAKDGSQPNMKELKTFHLEGGLSFHDPKFLEQVTDGVIAEMKNIGYDGIRWDGGPAPVSTHNVLGGQNVAGMKEAMELTAKNVVYMKKRVKEAGLPHFFQGFNGDSFGYAGIIHSLTAEQKDPKEFPQFVEMMRDGGMLMDESMMNCVIFTDPLNIIRDYYRCLVQQRTACRKVGGYMEGFPAVRRGAVLSTTDIYWYVLSIAAGTHIPAAYAPVPYSDDGLAHFLTRFCEFVWDEQLVPLPDAANAIRVEAPRELWYHEGAVWKQMGDRCRVVIPLVNPPPGERFMKFRYGELAEPMAEPFRVTVRRPDGYKGKVRVFMLSAEPKVQAVPLEAKATAQEVSFQVPELKVFRFLVIEFGK